MSAEAVTVVLHHSNTEGTAKLVLWGIANHHSDAGAWPSISTLAKYAKVSERRVQQIIRELAKDGEIVIQEQGGLGQNQYKTNRYQILIQCPADCDGSLNHRTGVKSGAVRGEIQSVSGVKPISPELNIELNKEPNAHFDEFWNEYPLKKDKGAAFKAFRSALKRAKFEDILAGAIAYAHDPQRKPEFTKYPATWLNADAWENVIAPSPDSEAALRIEARRERERKATQELLRKEAEAREKSAPAPKCKHGKNIALCNPCLRELEDA